MLYILTFKTVLENERFDDTDVVSVSFKMEVLQESKMMIHDSHRRLVAAHGVLVQLLVSNIHTHNKSNCIFNFFCTFEKNTLIYCLISCS